MLSFRPDWSDLARASIVAIAWGAIALFADLTLGANYGFIGNPPAGTRIPPLVEAFGAVAATRAGHRGSGGGDLRAAAGAMASAVPKFANVAAEKM